MNYEIIVSFLGSAMGCIAGILTSQKLTNYRLEQLEAKVNKHNNLVERMYKLESVVERLSSDENARAGRHFSHRENAERLAILQHIEEEENK